MAYQHPAFVGLNAGGGVLGLNHLQDSKEGAAEIADTVVTLPKLSMQGRPGDKLPSLRV